MEALDIDNLELEFICSLEDIIENTGVCALINDDQVAVFRLKDDVLYAVDNLDPFSQANVLSRGLVGESNNIIYVASPIYKQRFNLETGEFLDDPNIKIKTFPVVSKGNKVYLGKNTFKGE